VSCSHLLAEETILGVAQEIEEIKSLHLACNRLAQGPLAILLWQEGYFRPLSNHDLRSDGKYYPRKEFGVFFQVCLYLLGMATNEYIIEKSKTDRAKCKHSKCGKKVTKGELRVGKIAPNPLHEGSRVTLWYANQFLDSDTLKIF